MRAPAAVAALCLGACLEVPPASCPGGGDFDEDGWPCGGVVPDCDDGDPEINPGVADVCGTDLVEDCGATPVTCPLPAGLVSGTTPGDATWGVHGGGISTTFEQGLQWVLSSIVPEMDGVELLSQVQGGAAEQYVGVTQFPQFDQWQVGSATPTALDAGPAYVRIQVAWSSDVADGVGDGLTTFGFFPDATIHRHERFTTPGSTAANAYLSSHWSLDAFRFTNLDTIEGDQPMPANPTGVDTLHVHNGGGVDPGVACAYHAADGRRVTMAWRDGEAEGSRVVYGRQSPAHDRLSLNYDWLRNVNGIAADTYESITMLAVDRIDATGSPCASAGTLADALREPPALAFVEGAAGVNADPSGYVVDEGVYEIEAATGEAYVEVRTVGAAVRGLAFRVAIDAPDGVTVWRDGTRLRVAQDYFVQASDGGVTVFLRDRLDAGATLRIAAPGGEPTT